MFIISLSLYVCCDWSILSLKLVLLPKCFVIYRSVFLTSTASESLKLSYTLNYVIKRANDLKTVSN